MTASVSTQIAMIEQTFAGRVALVTGGAGAIGRATAEALAARGATVFAADVGSAREGTNTLNEVRLNEVRLDVTRKADIAAVVARIVDAHGAIDLLVNVAGVISHGSAEDLAEAEWDRVL